MRTKTLIIGVLSMLIGVAIIGQWYAYRTPSAGFVGSLAIQHIETKPASPTTDDMVSLKLGLIFTGRGRTDDHEFPLQATIEKQGDSAWPPVTADLSIPPGLGVSGEFRWNGTAELGKLPAGEHVFSVALKRPAIGWDGEIAPPREVKIVVGSDTNP